VLELARLLNELKSGWGELIRAMRCKQRYDGLGNPAENCAEVSRSISSVSSHRGRSPRV